MLSTVVSSPSLIVLNPAAYSKPHQSLEQLDPDMKSVRHVEPDRRAVSNDSLKRGPERIFSIEQQRVIVKRQIAYPEMIMVPCDFVIYALGSESCALRLEVRRGTERAPEEGAHPV